MSAVRTSAGGPSGPLAAFSQGNTRAALITVLKYLGMIIVDALALVIVYSLVRDDNLLLALVVGLITVMVNVFNLVPGLYPFKWMSPGLALVTLLVIYPILYTVITSFTNYSEGHLLTKAQAIDLISQRKYLPDDATLYDWALYQAGEGQYALWLTREAGGTLEVLFAVPGEPLTGVETDSAEPPETYGDYRLLSRAERAQALSTIQDMQFGAGDDTVGIKNRNQAARPYHQRYVFDYEQNAFLDQATNTYYFANDELGFFIPKDRTVEDALTPGYRVGVGFDNFLRLVEDPGLRGPLLDVFAWTVTFALGSVLTTFALGLFMAVILNDPVLPFRKVIRSLLIIPYAVPGVISILTWRGMLNPNLGVISTNLAKIGVSIPWFSDPWWAKVAILMVNLWLGYPYMMLICSGALQSIPKDIYEASDVDGASVWQRFWKITLPLLLVSVGPLLIASFTFNFNNYLIIEGLTQGNPPIPGTITPAGYTDILINYTYNLAFGSDRGADYGYASAITIIIFAITAGVTLLQYRFTKTWEEVGENV